MNKHVTTTHIGPLGSTIHVLRADADTVTEPRLIDASVVLEGLTPGDVCEAADGVRRSLTPEEATEAVTRVVRRRQRSSVRVREEEGAYHS